MFGWIILAIFLFLLASVLLVAEVFVPSGGVIAGFSILCLIGGVTIFFRFSSVAGIMGIIAAMIIVPVSLVVAYKVFPYTRFGKTVVLTPPERHPGDAIPDTEIITELLGKTARVISPLRPVGMCDFDGKRFECVAESGYIERDNNVTVIRVEGTQLTVRLVGNQT